MTSAQNHHQQLNGNDCSNIGSIEEKHLYMKKGKNILITAILTLGLASQPLLSQMLNEETFKVGRTLSLIDSWYVDSVNISTITEKVIMETLRNLDPHSVYISAKDVKEMNEPLDGNFEGIGIQFNLLRDSIIVIEPLSGGPSEKAGLRSGDRIISIDGESVTGMGISTIGVRTRLMGAKGTIVNLSIFRKGQKDLLYFTITRDKIPINSLDAAYMLDGTTGYIKLNRFAAPTLEEFSNAVSRLKKNKMQNLVLDLRGNGGGYMLAATEIADKFFDDQKLLVYLSGRKHKRQDYKSKGAGSLAGARIIVLVDESSASASEILAGALQDWDRGVIMGRRTFGKGLVQNQFYMTDGSMIRLTVARYFTPTGRSIQSPYNEGYEKYLESFYKRYTNGEMMTSDSIHFPDSLMFKTLVNKRTVYGGGGIMPDVFIAADTSGNSNYFRNLVRRGVLNTYILEYYDQNRSKLTSTYKTFEDFEKGFIFSEDEIKALTDKGEQGGIRFNESQFNISRSEMLKAMKALLATNIWQLNEYYRILNEGDAVLTKAIEIISDRTQYNKILGYPR